LSNPLNFNQKIFNPIKSMIPDHDMELLMLLNAGLNSCVDFLGLNADRAHDFLSDVVTDSGYDLEQFFEQAESY